MEQKYIVGFVVAMAIVVTGIVLVSNRTTSNNNPQSPYDLSAFASCLKEQKAIFYGAFWCTHCQNTKKVFGDAASLLPYVECSTPDTQNQLPICIENKISSYPTWVFADGSVLKGELSSASTTDTGLLTINDLAQKSGCPINLISVDNTNQ